VAISVARPMFLRVLTREVLDLGYGFYTSLPRALPGAVDGATLV